jgi:hypothetical protein
MKTTELIYLIENAEQSGDSQTVADGVAARAELAALTSAIHRIYVIAENARNGAGEYNAVLAQIRDIAQKAAQ